MQPLVFMGRYADGRSAAAVECEVRLGEAGLEIREPDVAEAMVWSYASLRAAIPIAAMNADAVLANGDAPGASLYVAGDGLARGLLARAPHLSAASQRWRAVRPGLLVGISALLIGLAVWLLQLSPSKALARLMPDNARQALGERVVEGMAGDKRFCSREDGAAALRRLVERVSSGHADSKGIEVRVLDWDRVNAFAAPGGKIVLTRGILREASSAEEIAGVLAHEIGHSVELHPEAGLIRGIGIITLVQFMFTGSTGTLGNLGIVAAQLSYTREAEREADAVGLAILRKARIAPGGLAAFFERAEKEEPSTARGKAARAMEILSTHPSNPERIASIRGVPGYPSEPVLAFDEWQSLRNICRSKP